MSALLLAAVCGGLLLIAYFTYGRWVGKRVFTLREDAPTPAVVFEDGKDYVPTAKSVIFGHHFTSIAGTGPIVGPAIAVMWGWLPAVIWVLVGGIFIGAVHDLGSLVVSLRNKGRTVGDIAGDLLGARVRLIFFAVLVLGLWIVLAIFGLVIASVLRQFPSAIFPVLFQVPLAIVIGLAVHRRGGSIGWVSVAALALMYASVVFGDASWGPTIGGLHAFNQWLAAQPLWAWTVGLLVYCYAASVLPVWVLLQPRDYINALQLVSALGLIVVGLVGAAFLGGAPSDMGGGASDVVAGVVSGGGGSAGERLPLEIVAPAVNWAPSGAPPIVPMLFITIACGAISGFHCLVSSGTTSKQVKKETDALAVGYGSMLTESFLAILVIVACAAGIGLGVTKPLEGIGRSQMTSDDVRFEAQGDFGVFPLGADGESLTIGVRRQVVAASESDPSLVGRRRDIVEARIGPAGKVASWGVGGATEDPLWWNDELKFQNEGELRRPAFNAALASGARAELEGGTVRVFPERAEVALTGRLAYLKQYESWNAAGGLAATVGAFVTGSANLIEAIGVPRGVALALMGVLVASFAGTTMDTACRLQRYVVQELARTFLPRRTRFACVSCGYDLSGTLPGGGRVEVSESESVVVRCPECGVERPEREIYHHVRDVAWEAASPFNPFRWLATAHGATLFAVATAMALAAIPAQGQAWTLANAGKGGMILWPLFGATNQLLGGLAFIVIFAWLRATGRPVWFMVLPAVFMLIVPAWAMAWQVFVGNGAQPAWARSGDWLLAGTGIAMLALEAWLLVEVVARWRGRSGKAESRRGGARGA